MLHPHLDLPRVTIFDDPPKKRRRRSSYDQTRDLPQSRAKQLTLI
jgi:hypothetical protein